MALGGTRKLAASSDGNCSSALQRVPGGLPVCASDLGAPWRTSGIAVRCAQVAGSCSPSRLPSQRGYHPTAAQGMRKRSVPGSREADGVRAGRVPYGGGWEHAWLPGDRKRGLLLLSDWDRALLPGDGREHWLLTRGSLPLPGDQKRPCYPETRKEGSSITR